MKNLFAVIFSFIKNKVVTQDFKLTDKGYEYFAPIPFISRCDIWFKGIRPIIRYRGKKWEENRDIFMIARHGVTNSELQKPENAHLLVAKLFYVTN